MAKFVLVHGAWLDKTCWDDVAEILTAKGHDVVAFDLVGHGADVTELPAITLEAYVAQAAAGASELGAPVNLVGHSMAGMVITAAAEAHPELWTRLIYVAAFLPASGQSLNDLAQTDADSQLGPNVRPAADWSTLDVAEEARHDLFFHDVSDDKSGPLLANWKAEPVAPQVAPIATTAERFGSVPRTYIHSEFDRVISPSLQARMVAATPSDEHSLATGHLPMLVNPVGLADLLEAAAS
jgi:pimeloyl-ACP methyl ester carboxylesterase